jgi:hypothetical protein
MPRPKHQPRRNWRGEIHLYNPRTRLTMCYRDPAAVHRLTTADDACKPTCLFCLRYAFDPNRGISTVNRLRTVARLNRAANDLRP